MTATELRMWRASLHSGSVLALEEVIEALPQVKASEVRRRVSPATTVEGVGLYLWGDVLRAVGIDVGGSSAPRAPLVHRIPHAEAARLLGISPRTLKRGMDVTPPGEELWAELGTEKRPEYRWNADPDALRTWWERVRGWRASTSAATPGASAGEIPTAAPDPGARPPKRPRSRSAGKSRLQPPSAGGGRFRKWAEGLSTSQR